MKLLFFLQLILVDVGFAVGEAVISKTITVDLSGYGEYQSLQQAVDSVPDNNGNWIKIHVKQGIYNEKVFIGAPKTYILLEGEGAQNTVIQWSDFVTTQSFNTKELDLSSASTSETPTIKILSSNFLARDITFKNSYDQTNLEFHTQAVAAMVGGDMMSFYRCNFIGFQDTLYDYRGRHFFKDCLIEGSIDFIFGYAQSTYETCNLVTVGKESDVAGYVTAHGRPNEDTTGYVFNSCNLSGTRKTYLGRPWGPFSRVLFYRTTMTDVVVPQGWHAWRDNVTPDQTTYAETECSGPGSDKTGRVQWETNLSDQQWSTFTSDSFIDPEGWRSQQPI